MTMTKHDNKPSSLSSTSRDRKELVADAREPLLGNMPAKGRERSRRRGIHRKTRLEHFIREKGIVIEEILDELQMYRPQFNRYRFGLAEAREGIIIRIV